MKKIIALFLISLSLPAQDHALAEGLGGLAWCGQGPWGQITNPTYLNGTSGWSFGINQTWRPGLKDLNQSSLNLALVKPEKHFLLQIKQYGNQHYQENELNGALGLTLLPRLRLGLSLGGTHFYQAEIGSRLSLQAGLHLSGRLADFWDWHLVYSQALSKGGNEVPRANFENSLKVNSRLFLFCGMAIPLRGKPVMAASWQLKILENLSIRQGLSGPHSALHFGLAFQWRQWGLDFAYKYPKRLGSSLSLSLSYSGG